MHQGTIENTYTAKLSGHQKQSTQTKQINTDGNEMVKSNTKYTNLILKFKQINSMHYLEKLDPTHLQLI